MKDSSLPWTAAWLVLCVAGSCFIFTFAPWSPCTAFPLRLPLLQSNVPVKPPFLCASYYTQTLTAKRHMCPSECYTQMWHKDTEDKIFPRAHWQALNPFAVKFLLQPLPKLQNITRLHTGDVSLYQESIYTWKGVKEQQKTFHTTALNWLHRRLICCIFPSAETFYLLPPKTLHVWQHRKPQIFIRLRERCIVNGEYKLL